MSDRNDEAAVAEVRDMMRQYSRRQDPLRADLVNFCMVLIRARQQKGLSQAQLAKLIGKQQPAIASIESGHSNPGLRTLLAIAKALNLNLMLE